MAKIQIGGAGGAPSNGFIRSLKESKRTDYLVGTSCIATDLFLADVNEKYVVPIATSSCYTKKILSLLNHVKPDLLHAQNDFEVRAISRLRKSIEEIGTKLYLPSSETIENCIDKRKSYEFWRRAGLRVPETILLRDKNDLSRAFEKLGNKIWIRAVEGAAGQGSLPTDSYDFARIWIDHFNGWGKFTAAELLTEKTVTWQSIWFNGELVVAQTRRRHSWNFSNRAISGVTGITGVGETCSDTVVDTTAQDAIFAIDPKPHGIFAVDMTYDKQGLPNPTEINIGRFFTTHYFFTKAGLNFPEIYCDIALDNKFPTLQKKINPLPDGLIWIRGMDVEPVLTTTKELEKIQQPPQ